MAFIIAVAFTLNCPATGKPYPFPVGTKFSRAVQRWTGLNCFCQVLASKGVAFFLKQKLGGHISVKIKTFSLTDLLAGKVKSIDARLAGSHYRGVPLGKLHLAVAQPVWICYKRKASQRTGVRTPVLIKIDGDISEHELSEAVATPLISSALHMIKLNLPGLGEQRLQLLHPKVDLKDNLVVLETLLLTKGATLETGVPLTIVGSPKLENGSKIILQNLRVSSPDIPGQAEFSLFCQDLLNPLVDFGRMDRQDHAFRLQTLTITNDKLHYSGNLLLAPKPPKISSLGQVARHQ